MAKILCGTVAIILRHPVFHSASMSFYHHVIAKSQLAIDSGFNYYFYDFVLGFFPMVKKQRTEHYY